jgi:hypothetical protein
MLPTTAQNGDLLANWITNQKRMPNPCALRAPLGFGSGQPRDRRPITQRPQDHPCVLIGARVPAAGTQPPGQQGIVQSVGLM